MNKKNDDQVKDVALFASLAYIPFLALFLIMYKRDNEYMHFHARQGLVLFIFEALNYALMSLIPFLAFIFSIINLVLLAVCVIGLFNALMGKKVRFPAVTDLAEKMVV